MTTKNVISFPSGGNKAHLRDRTLLIPEMNLTGATLLAATFRSFGVRARVMETYKGLDLGKEYTSGKECFPCQVTLGDILLFLKTEQEKRGSDFDPENYLYFLPESDGPCRFGMYNKFQRMVLDTFPELDRVKIVSITTEDGYSLDGVIDENRMLDFRKASYLAVVVADIMERLLWRIRPYETRPGITDAQLIKAAERAGIADWINRHPLGFDMPISERGDSVSGGQRKCISVARALVTEPSILIMDEPTGGTDQSTERVIIENLKAYMEGRTLIVVTHRNSLLALADRILVIDAGKVVADGQRDAVISALREGKIGRADA